MTNDLGKVWLLFQSSDKFLSYAYCLSVETVKSRSTLNRYNTFIKCALNCLFTIANKFQNLLNAQIEATLYYKISYLLFNETASNDIAIDYCNRGIKLCKRNEPQLIQLKLQLQFLNFQIQLSQSQSQSPNEIHNSNPNPNKIVNYLNEVIGEIPDTDSYNSISIFFNYFKIDWFLNNSTFDEGVFALNKLVKNLESFMNESNIVIYQILLFEKVKLYLSRETTHENLNEINETLVKLQRVQLESTFENCTPLQFKSILCLLETIKALTFNLPGELRTNMKRLNELIRETSLNHWESDLIVIKLIDGFNIKVNVFSYEEFVMISFILLGLSNMDKSNEKSQKIFAKVLKLLKDNYLLVDKMSDKSKIKINDKLARLEFINRLTLLYSAHGNINANATPTGFNNEFKNGQLIGSTNQFSNYHTVPVLLAYSMFISNLSGQINGGNVNSMFEYLKLMSFIKIGELPIKSSGSDSFNVVQSRIGLPHFPADDEIYLFSSFNVIANVILKIKELKTVQESMDEFDDGYKQVMNEYTTLLNLKENIISMIEIIKPNLEEMNKESHGDNDWITYFTINILLYMCGYRQIEFIQFISRVVKMRSVSRSDNILGSNGSIIASSEIGDILSSPRKSNFVEYTQQDPLAKFAFDSLINLPILKSILYYINGEEYQAKFKSAIDENINDKIEQYTLSMRYASQQDKKRESTVKIKIKSEEPVTNWIGALSGRRILNIMKRNPNMFHQRDIDDINKRIENFKGVRYAVVKRHLEVNDENNVKVKRVKMFTTP